jgi:hypothetical protein
MSSSRFDQDYDADAQEIITLTDENGRSLECYIEQSLEEEDGYTYMLLLPVDVPVVFLAWDEEDESETEAIMLEDEDELTNIFDDAKAVLAELDLTLKHSAFIYTVSGELPPLEEEDILTLEVDEDNPEIEAEELQFLVSFYHEEQKYSIYTPLAPILFFARYTPTGKLEMVSPEDPQLQPIIEALMFEEVEE